MRTTHSNGTITKEYQLGDAYINANGTYQIYVNDGWYEIREGDLLPYDRKTKQAIRPEQIRVIKDNRIKVTSFMAELNAI